MKPPICALCGRPFDPSEEGGLVDTGPTPDPWWEGIADPEEVERHGPPTGHPPGVDWVCGDHAAEARSRRSDGAADGGAGGGDGSGSEGGSSGGFSRRWAWVALILVVTGVVARQWGDRIEREERRESHRLAGQAATAMYLERLRSAAPRGTPAAAYAGAAARELPGWRSSWRHPPLVHRLSQPLLMGTPTLEVTFAEGRVRALRAAAGPPPGNPIVPDSAAALLDLPPDLAVFAGDLPTSPPTDGDPPPR